MKFISYFYKILFCALLSFADNAYAGEPPPPPSSLVGKVMVSYWDNDNSYECHFFKDESSLIFKDAYEYSPNQYAWGSLSGVFYDYDFDESFELSFDTAYSGSYDLYREKVLVGSGTFVIYNGLWDLDDDGTPDGEGIQDGTLPNLSTPPSTANFQSINGQVTDQDGRPLEGVEVTAYQYVQEYGGYFTNADRAITDDKGNYSIQGFLPGTYKIGFSDSEGNYAVEYFNDTSSIDLAQDVAVSESEEVTDIDASLVTASKIMGKVTGSDGVTPLAGIYVTAYDDRDSDEWWDYVKGAKTNENGEYLIGGLSHGTYRVQFEDYDKGLYATKCYGGPAAVNSAENVILSKSSTLEGVNVSLSYASTISGMVTDSSGSPLNGISVSIHQYNSREDWWHWVSESSTDANGAYALRGVGSGTYRIEFRDYSGKYASEANGDAANIESADDLLVVAPAPLTDINATLSKASSISGKVTGPSGNALPNVEIDLERLDDDGQWRWHYGAETDAEGRYDLTGLRAGVYRMEIEDEKSGDFASGQYALEYYDDAVEFDLATNINLGNEENPTIDVSMVLGSRIRGNVTGPDGKPFVNVSVEAFRLNSKGKWEWYEDTKANADGDYQLGSLPNGTYRVAFLDEDSLYSVQFRGDNGSTVYFDLAKEFTINGPQMISGVNGQFKEKASIISGKVTDMLGGPLHDVRIEAYRNEQGEWRLVLFGDLDASDQGVFDAEPLPAGTYRFKFEKDGYITKYYGDSTQLADAKDIVVGEGQKVDGIDVILRKVAMPQAIGALSSIGNKTFGDAPFTVTAPSASSSLPVTLSVKSGPATISANTVTLTGAGEVVLAANQAGNADYAATTEVTIGFTVVLPPITSDLSDALVAKGKAINPYKVTTSFGANSYSVKKLPPGLKFNAKTGVISGKPKKPGTYGVVITAAKKKGKKILQKETVVKVFVVK
jgi:5-hydroxyisourate hydrolase-like protein (transthyretin family)